MPPLPMPLDPPDKVFGLAAPHHMLMKLKWEIFQLRTVAAEPCEPGAEIEPGYHAFNCAVTAWHMADWVWQSASPRLMIRDGDVSRSALEVFEEAARTWDQLLREWGYLEAR